jgi:hypothetical protein
MSPAPPHGPQRHPLTSSPASGMRAMQRCSASCSRAPRSCLALLLVLGRAWPASVPRDELAARAFAVRRVNASHRARLRVELGRLRKIMDGLAAEPFATPDGYALASTREVAVLLPPSDDEADRIALLLGDGASWSAQGLAEHAGVSKRTAQRALGALVASGTAVRTGKGRDLRYTRPGLGPVKRRRPGTMGLPGVRTSGLLQLEASRCPSSSRPCTRCSRASRRTRYRRSGC